MNFGYYLRMIVRFMLSPFSESELKKRREQETIYVDAKVKTDNYFKSRDYAARSLAKWKKSTEEPVTPYL